MSVNTLHRAERRMSLVVIQEGREGLFDYGVVEAWPKQAIQSMEDAAAVSTAITVERLAEGGAPYLHKDGKPGIVPANCGLVAIRGFCLPRSEIANFWLQVDYGLRVAK